MIYLLLVMVFITVFNMLVVGWRMVKYDDTLKYLGEDMKQWHVVLIYAFIFILCTIPPLSIGSFLFIVYKLMQVQFKKRKESNA